MTFAEFQRALESGQPVPVGLSSAQLALWHDAKGDWDAAHTASQNDDGRNGAWVHAYLHRTEGDRGNAGYWYARAGRPMPPANSSLDAEWIEIARTLFGEASA